MDQFFTPELIQVLVSFLIALLGLATWKITQYMGGKAHGEKISNALWEINELVSAAVHEAEAIAVREAKAGGKWDDARKQAVKQEVVENVKANLTGNTSKFLIKNFGDLNAYINGLVERQVAESKVEVNKCQ